MTQAPAVQQELIRAARLIEDMKQDCGMDPESPTAIRNGRLMSIAAILRALAAAPVQAAPEPVRMTDAARDVLAERQRQIEREGWAPERDDQHNNDELAEAAACYINPHPRLHSGGSIAPRLPIDWPWDVPDWRPKDRRRNLVRGTALALAEIERLDRAGRTIPKE